MTGRTLALSDLHFGDPYGLLAGEWATWGGRVLSSLTGASHLRLVGDIWEDSIPESIDAVADASRAFFRGLTQDRPLEDLVWIVGNHDHALRDGGEELVRVLLGDASARVGRVTVARTHLVERIGVRRVLYTHGHLFDGLMRGASGADRAQQVLVAAIAGSRAHPGDVTGAATVDELEERLTPWLDAVWGRPEPVGPRAQLWELLCRFDRAASCAAALDAHRGVAGRCEERTEPGEATLQALAWFLALVGEQPDAVVYGHTHSGATFQAGGAEVLNCGAWTTGPSGQAPHSHAVVFEADGRSSSWVVRFSPEWIDERRRHGRQARTLDVGTPFDGHGGAE